MCRLVSWKDCGWRVPPPAAAGVCSEGALRHRSRHNVGALPGVLPPNCLGPRGLPIQKRTADRPIETASRRLGRNLIRTFLCQELGRSAAGAALLLGALVACDRPHLANRGAEVVRDTVDEVERVRNLGGRVWADGVTVDEDLRIGVLTGDEALMFGDVVEMAVASDGRFFVFDRQVPALRVFDASGQFVRTIGAKGRGPGEYQDAVTGLAIRADGALFAHDVKNRRIVVFNGTTLAPIAHWPVSSNVYVDHSVTTDTLGNTFVRILTGRPRGDAPWPMGLLRMGPDGTPLDTIPPPTMREEPTGASGPLSPGKVWTQTPYVTVVGISGSYEFEIRPRDGSGVKRVSRTATPIKVEEDEWVAQEALREWEIRDESPEVLPPHTPRTKPFFKGFEVAADGRIWVRKSMPGVRSTESVPRATNGRPSIPFEEPTGFDVFEPDGTYLGEVILPIGFRPLWIGSDRVYGVRPGEQGEELVVRYRIAPNRPPR